MIKDLYEKCKLTADIKDCPEPSIGEMNKIMNGLESKRNYDKYDVMLTAFRLGVLKERSRAEYARKKARAAG